MELIVNKSFNDNGMTYFLVENLFFHPQGGGQPNDKLFDRESNYVDIRKIDDSIYLGVNPLSINDGRVDIYIDDKFNFLCSRLHSAGHLIALVLEREFGVKPVKAHHFPNEAYIKFEGDVDKEQLEYIKENVDAECKKDLFVTITHDEKGRFVNFDGIGGYHCGGTHVKSLLEIGDVIIKSISNKKGIVTIKYDL